MREEEGRERGAGGTTEQPGGDPACWLARVCPECGAFQDREPAIRCERCGAELPAS